MSNIKADFVVIGKGEYEEELKKMQFRKGQKNKFSLNENDIVKAVEKLMKNENELKEYRRKAIAYTKEFDWNEILNQAFGVRKQ